MGKKENSSADSRLPPTCGVQRSNESPAAPTAPAARSAEGTEAPPLWHSRPISDEPLVNAVHRRVIEIVFVSYAAVLVYMSFVPFDFMRYPTPWSGRGFAWGLAVTPFSLRDILANLAFYLPLGALAHAVWRRRRLGRLLSSALAVLTAGGVSLFVEYGQHWVASRVSTWVDVTSNVLGALLGVMLVALSEPQIRRIAANVRSAARRNWPLALANAAVCVVLIVQLRPFDVTVDLFHAAASLRHADPSPMAGWRNLQTVTAREVAEGRREGMNELPRAQWEYGLDRVADTAAYATVVALLVLGLAPQFSRRAALYLWSGFVVVSLAGLVTGIRVFLISHGLDTSHLVCGLLGWPVGCVIGSLLLRERPGALWHPRLAGANTGQRPEPQELSACTPKTTPAAPTADGCIPERIEGSSSLPSRPRQPTIVVPVAGRRVVLAGILAFIVLSELVPFDFGTGPGAISPSYARRVCLMPFKAHFHARPNDAFYDLSGELLRYGVMGACLALILQPFARLSWRRQLGCVVAATGLSATALECLHLVMASRQTDVTTMLLAMTGAFAGAVTVRWVRDYRSSLEPTMVDDLLTSQLIEGAAYQALPSPKRGSVRRDQDSISQP